MKVTIYILILMTLTFRCGQVNKDNPSNHDNLLSKNESIIPKSDTAKNDSANNHSDTAKYWTDSLIKNYIKNFDNKLIRLALKEKITEEWLFDQVINSDTAKYFVFQIGHDVLASGDKNKRFITCLVLK